MDDCGRTSLAVGLAVLLIVFLNSWSSLQPTEYGLQFNSYTGYVDRSTTYTGGRHFIGIGRSFIVFPSTQVLLTMSGSPLAQAPPIDARTGRDASDPDSGGQPVQLSVSVLYKLSPDKLGEIYRSFSTQYESRYIQYVRQAVSNVAQQFLPTQFWTDRDIVAEAMFTAVKQSLASEGFCEVMSLQLLKVSFSSKYEDQVVNIQLATQTKTTTEYQKQVVRVLKDIDILESQTNASIAVIAAEAAAHAKLIVNQAAATGFNLTQAAKSASYTLLRDKLDFTSGELLDYVRLKSIRTHQSDKLIVGMEAPYT